MKTYEQTGFKRLVWAGAPALGVFSTFFAREVMGEISTGEIAPFFIAATVVSFIAIRTIYWIVDGFKDGKAIRAGQMIDDDCQEVRTETRCCSEYRAVVTKTGEFNYVWLLR